MDVVVLVGAGATLAEAQPSQPSRDEMPPLDGTFFRLCRLNDFDGGHDLRRYLSSAYGIDPYEGDHRMEEIFNYIYADTHSPKTPKLCRQAYWGLIRMYAEGIAETTNPLKGNSYYGVGAVLRNLWKLGKVDSLSFITFNQDLVIEKALEFSVRNFKTYRSIPWNINNCYRAEFSRVDPIRKTAEKFTTGTGPAIPVLKLHGSLNWVYQESFSDYHDLLDFLEDPKGQPVCQNDREIHGNLQYRVGGKRVRTIPFIVPPVYDKDPHSHKVLSPVWTVAGERLREADKLVIFGYSFPQTDVSAQTLLKRNYYANEGLNDVTIIDTNSSAAARIADLLGAEVVNYYRSVRSFTSELQSQLG